MSLKKQATSGLMWTFTQQFGNQLIGFVVSIFLARLLLPSEFGLVGMIAIFYSIGRSLMDSGMTQSLIRQKESTQEDLSTVFYFNVGVSILLYIILYFSAPLISLFYEQSILKSVVRLYCLTFIIDSFTAVQRARLVQQFNFKTEAVISIPSTLIGGGVGIWMALNDFGVYALVWSHILTSLMGSIQFWIYSKWTPSFFFSRTKLKEHFDFGYKLTLSALIDKVFNNVYLLVIGKVFSPTQVGYFTRADSMRQLPVRNLTNALSKVTYPLFAKFQDKDKELRRMYRQLLQMVVFIVMPFMVFLAVLAKPIFIFLFTEKWVPAVPYFQILCIAGILYPFNLYNLNILKVKGRSDLHLKVSALKKGVTVILLAIGIQFGMYGVLAAVVGTTIISYFLNYFYTNQFLKYSLLQQFQDTFSIALIVAFSVAVILAFNTYLIGDNNILQILIGFLVGSLFYVGLSFITKQRVLKYFKTYILKS